MVLSTLLEYLKSVDSLFVWLLFDYSHDFCDKPPNIWDNLKFAQDEYEQCQSYGGTNVAAPSPFSIPTRNPVAAIRRVFKTALTYC